MSGERADRLRIAETFTSIQGEGALVGTPSFFIRSTTCNLRCEWCDTPYTSWQPEGEWRSVEELAADVPAAVRHVVVTGGEPMLWPALPALTAALRAGERHVTIETAGTIHRSLACDLMSISPKLANSDPGPTRSAAVREEHRARRLVREPLRQLLAEYRCQLKFVIGAPADLDDVENLLEELAVARDRSDAPHGDDAKRGRDAASPPDGRPRPELFLMPLGTGREELAERARWLVPLCAARGYRFTPRLHIDLWGDIRGR